MKILIADDSQTMRRIQRHILKKLGYVGIEEVSNGLEAKKAVAEDMPGLILLDWNMPEMDGLEFLKELRQEEQDVPVIMVTTEAEKTRVLEAIKAGVNNYVIKPFTPEVLKARIEETIETAEANHAAAEAEAKAAAEAAAEAEAERERQAQAAGEQDADKESGPENEASGEAPNDAPSEATVSDEAPTQSGAIEPPGDDGAPEAESTADADGDSEADGAVDAA